MACSGRLLSRGMPLARSTYGSALRTRAPARLLQQTRSRATFNTAKGFEHVEPTNIGMFKKLATGALLAGLGFTVYYRAFFQADIWIPVQQKYLCDDVTITATTSQMLPVVMDQTLQMTFIKQMAEPRAQLLKMLPEGANVTCTLTWARHIIYKYGGIYGVANSWDVETVFAIEPYQLSDGSVRQAQAYIRCNVHIPDKERVTDLTIVPLDFIVKFQTEGSEEEEVVSFKVTKELAGDAIPADPSETVNPSWCPPIVATLGHELGGKNLRFSMSFGDPKVE